MPNVKTTFDRGIFLEQSEVRVFNSRKYVFFSKSDFSVFSERYNLSLIIFLP